MVVKLVESTYDSFKDKLKNPFYGTLFIVWIVRNREFIYNVFFNPDCTSDQRLEIIRNQFLNWNSVWSFIGTIFISLGLMILIYGSLNLSRFIIEFSERKLKPRIQEIFSETTIVSRDDYLAMERDRDYFQKKYSEERIERIKLQRESDQKIESMTVDGGVIDDNRNSKVNTEISTNSQINHQYFANWDNKLIEDFKILIGYMNDRKSYEETDKRIFIDSMTEFKRRNIIKLPLQSKYATQYYEFTELGKKVRDFFVLNFS